MKKQVGEKMAGSEEKEQVNAKNFFASLQKQVKERREAAAKLSAPEHKKAVEEELARVQKLHTENPGRYHDEVLLQGGGVENLLKHFGRVHLSPRNGQPKRLIVVISGNNEPLTRPWDRFDSYRGTMYMFDQMTKMNMENTDIIQLKAGEGFGAPAEFHTSVALAHIQNIINDAIAGVGAFTGRTYDRARMYGFSYGAGACERVLEGLEKRSKDGGAIPRIERTVYLDGVEYGTFGTALRKRSGLSQQHYHLHQKNLMDGYIPLNGNSLLAPNKSDFEMEMKRDSFDWMVQQKVKMDHRTLHDARYNRGTFDGILAALTHG